MSDEGPPVMAVDEIVQKYIALRDLKNQKEEAHKKELAKINTVMDKLEGFLLKQLDDTGVESMRTAEGTAFVTTKTGARVADWQATLAFVRENNAWDMLTQGVAKTFVSDYKKEHNDLPPGVSWFEERVVQIRRS